MECPSIGPCAGTCERCDEESGYLRKQLQKIPVEKRIYPQFDPGEEVLIINLFRLKELVEVSRFHVRVPRIPGYNKRENIEKSVEWIKMF